MSCVSLVLVPCGSLGRRDIDNRSSDYEVTWKFFLHTILQDRFLGGVKTQIF